MPLKPSDMLQGPSEPNKARVAMFANLIDDWLQTQEFNQMTYEGHYDAVFNQDHPSQAEMEAVLQLFKKEGWFCTVGDNRFTLTNPQLRPAESTETS